MLLLAVSSLSLDAEVIVRHTCSGYFTVDRWGQGVLHQGPYHLFVAESAYPSNRIGQKIGVSQYFSIPVQSPSPAFDTPPREIRLLPAGG